MKPTDTLKRIKNLNRLIISGQTGTPAEFAATIGIRQSHLFRCLHQLERYGMDLHYSRLLKTYYYGNDVELTINYPVILMADCKTLAITWGARFLKRYHQDLERTMQGKTVADPGWTECGVHTSKMKTSVQKWNKLQPETIELQTIHSDRRNTEEECDSKLVG